MSEKFKSEYLGFGMVFWFGVVEDRGDPIKLGRVRVRIYGWHENDKALIPTSSLPWSQVIQQPTSAANGDIGYSPTGILEGTWVVGFFLDGDKGQQPIIIGTLAGIPTESIDTGVGFFDPNGVYPKRLNEPDVNRLARNDEDFPHPVVKAKNDSRTLEVPILSTDNIWDEPESAYAAIYPKNHVYESESGHIKEYDDTIDNRRIHEYHASGTFYEIDNAGNKVTRIVGNNYVVVAGSDFVNVKGSVNLTIDSDCNTYVKGNWNIKVDGNLNETIGGNQTTAVTGNIKINGATVNINDGTQGAARIGDAVPDSEVDGTQGIGEGSGTVKIGD